MTMSTSAPTGRFYITSPFTNLPIEETPSGISLKDKTFETKEELEKFVAEHWPNAAFTVDVPV